MSTEQLFIQRDFGNTVTMHFTSGLKLCKQQGLATWDHQTALVDIMRWCDLVVKAGKLKKPVGSNLMRNDS